MAPTQLAEYARSFRKGCARLFATRASSDAPAANEGRAVLDLSASLSAAVGVEPQHMHDLVQRIAPAWYAAWQRHERAHAASIHRASRARTP